MTTKRWVGGILGALAAAALVVSCGDTGGGGDDDGGSNPPAQFILNSNNAGRLILNVDPKTVDANKSDRIGLTAQLTDSQGNGISGVTIVFASDIDDIEFVPGGVGDGGVNFGEAITDASGRADVIAIAGSTPTGTGAIVGTGAIFAAPPASFGLKAQVPVTLLDVGFIDSDVLQVIPAALELVEPAPGQVLFFNITGGTPPYDLQNEVSGIGTAIISQHCLPGCTENGGVFCVGSPCQSDNDCNLNGSSTPSGVCAGPIRRCLASCAGSNCAGARCGTDADCNDGSPTPANVCKDSGQSIVYIIAANPAAGTHGFTVQDSGGSSVTVEVTTSFVCGNGVARGDEQCDVGDLRDETCTSTGHGNSGSLTCADDCTFDFTNCTFATPTAAVSGGPTPTGGGGGTATPTAAAPTVTPTPGPGTPTAAGTPGAGIPSNLTLAVLTNGSGDNGNGTLTTVFSATVTDINGNQVPDGTSVLFGITAPTNGAIISSPSATNQDPPCDVTNFQTDTGETVLNQPGVAHTCLTYPVAQANTQRTINAVSGAGFDSTIITLPQPPP